MDKDSRQVGAGVLGKSTEKDDSNCCDETGCAEITPEMIDAGARVLECLTTLSETAKEFAEECFIAMLLASQNSELRSLATSQKPSSLDPHENNR